MECKYSSPNSCAAAGHKDCIRSRRFTDVEQSVSGRSECTDQLPTTAAEDILLQKITRSTQLSVFPP